MQDIQFAQAEEHLSDLISKAEAGESLVILRGGKPVARMVPFHQPVVSGSDADRQASVARLTALMEEGIDMGGFKIANRDELYDRA